MVKIDVDLLACLNEGRLMPLRTQNPMILLSVSEGLMDGPADERRDTPAQRDAMDASKACDN